MLWVRTNSIPDQYYFVSLATFYFSSNRISSNARTNYFHAPMLEVKIVKEAALPGGGGDAYGEG